MYSIGIVLNVSFHLRITGIVLVNPDWINSSCVKWTVSNECQRIQVFWDVPLCCHRVSGV